ncbi:3-phenylpropionate/cinnamic acid dioxygenase ferredoxin--NAD(+) reductase component [Paraburkholderia hiiakae]|uniref:3-phenylpropionate/cinnamic acid dioxygenase ferredoxin--NAD(+) reductase component n=1 Tax=Paraburkholderia hiiakae TaxID=1081782 RepID=A0ABN7IB70_9BURK|nr:FAD-dependent oxidoreductase [Paraburkholderia hiiakae]CAD6556521.1 3-phenylpropionate/cinnamic acid dioxygenase ferredoxin--NAD(+) reductase component [Paraburkholderia hiiakae]
MAGWIKAMDMAGLPAQGMRRVEIEGTPVLLVNTSGQIRAFTGNCPHAGAPLDQGALCEGRIVCPWHKAVFSIDDGRWLEPPALEGLSTYPVRVDGDGVFVELEPKRPRVMPIARADGGAARRFAIIGGGAAGAAAAATLLESDCDAEVTMFAAEPQAPYDRTCLSKFVPAGEMAPDDVPPILPGSVESDPRMRIEHVEVKRFDVPTKQVTLADGRVATFDAVLIACGSAATRPAVPGADLGRIYTLRNVGDAAAILNALSPGEHAVILGDSFIGLETASALRKRGVEVTIVAPGGLPLQRALGARVGALFREWHEANGVVFRRSKASRFEGAHDVEAVCLDDGGALRAKAVIAGIGVRPATQFVTGIELDEDGGVSVDETMRAMPDVYAVGDIARFPLDSAAGTPQWIRIEHWRVAQQQARIAALNMLGHNVRYEGVPFFWTEHYGRRIDYLGHADHWDDLVISGRPGDERFGILYSRLGHLQAALACGYEREMALLSVRMREHLSIDSARSILGL